MPAEASECNGGSKGEFEVKGGGDLKDLKGCNGPRCREGEENGSDGSGESYVMVNTDSDDHSEGDLDLEGKKPQDEGEVVVGDGDRRISEKKGEDGELRVDREENRGKGESCENGEKGELIVENGDGSNGKSCKEDGEDRELCSRTEIEEKEKVEVLARASSAAAEKEQEKGEVEVKNDEQHTELSSAVDVAGDEKVENLPVKVEEKQMDDSQIETGQAVEVVEDEKRGNLVVEVEEKQAGDSQIEAGQTVEVEQGQDPEGVVVETECAEELVSSAEMKQEEAEVEKELGSSVEVQQKLKDEKLVAEAEEKQEGEKQTKSELDVKVEGQEHELAVPETDHQVELGSAVEVGDVNEQLAIVTETDQAKDSESAAQVNEPQAHEDVVTEISDKGEEGKQELEAVVDGTDNVADGQTQSELHVKVKEQEEVAVPETDFQVKLRSAVEVEDVKELPTVFTESDHVADSASAAQVKELQGHEHVVTGTNDKVDIESTEVEEKQGAAVVVDSIGDVLVKQTEAELDVKVEEHRELVVPETDHEVKLQSVVEAEGASEHQTVIAETDQAADSESEVHEPVVGGINDKGDVESAEGEEKQGIEAVVDGIDNVANKQTEAEMDVKVEGREELAVPENDHLVESQSPVEVEDVSEHPTVIAESDQTADSESVAHTNDSQEHEITCKVDTESADKEEKQVLGADVDGTGNAAEPEPEPAAEVESTQVAEVLVAEATKAEVEEKQNADIMIDGVAGSEHQVESKQEPAVSLSETDKTEAESTVKHEEEEVQAKEVTCSIDEDHAHAEDINGPTTNVDSNHSFPEADISKEADESNSHSSGNDTGLETEIETGKGTSIDHVKGTKLGSEGGDESAESVECTASSVEEDRSTNDDGENPSNEQVESAEVIQAPAETHVVTRRQLYIARVPRFDDMELQEKKRQAQFQVNEKTQSRDSIGYEIQKKKALRNQYQEDLKTEASEEKVARAAFNAKRQEIDSVQVTISKMKNVSSIAEMDDKIRSMEHKQQHDTISLKQEKEYIREINQLKQRREQLASKTAPQQQTDEAFGPKDEVEMRYKTLQKELDSLRVALLQAEGRRKTAYKKVCDEAELIKDLQDQYRRADDLRQEEYASLQKLKKELSDKAQHYFMYRNDQRTAMDYRFVGDNVGLQSHCNKQVGRFMELWNNDDEFRKQYVKANTYSTLRRLGTPDGRSLGPGEEAPILHSYVNKRNSVSLTSSNVETPAPTLAVEVKQERPAKPLEVKQERSAKPLASEQGVKKDQSSKLKSSIKSTSREAIIATVSNSEEAKDEEKENKPTKEEEELLRKAEELSRKEEELRKEKADAELREQLRIEQKAKAKAAEERKRRQAEKAQAKAEYKAQKEAELRAKKKAKKEKKKIGTVDTKDGGLEAENTPITETTTPERNQDPDTKGLTVSRKRTARPASALKQYDRIQPVPLHLRNKGKRTMRTWMWVLLTALLVLLLFLAGNYVSFSKFSLPDFSF